jgi:hypothetical protein
MDRKEVESLAGGKEELCMGTPEDELIFGRANFSAKVKLYEKEAEGNWGKP